MKSLLCLIGSHKYRNTDGKGIVGRYECQRKGCDAVIEARKWPDPPTEQEQKNSNEKRTICQ